MRILVVAAARDPHRQAEALRAALGLTLRGAEVEVVAAAPPLTPLACRLADTLRSFGHAVTHPEAPEDPADAAAAGAGHDEAADLLAGAVARADRVEVWT
ncbi:MAG TPA: hypothetical protein VGD37_42295 [Kofleriaceae bacterium]|jgi:hypothetical protein